MSDFTGQKHVVIQGDDVGTEAFTNEYVQITMTDQTRRDAGIGADAGIYDPTRDIWHVLPEGLRYYRPDLFATLVDDPDADYDNR